MDRRPQIADNSRVFNLNETSAITVQKPKKVTTQKEVKQLNQCTGSEREQMVAIVEAVCVAGTFLLPVMIFLRKYFKNRMLNGVLTGALGFASSGGWMTTERLPQATEHIIQGSHGSKQ